MKTTAHTVLLTGFEPFGGEPENPSLAIARALDRKRVAGHRIIGAALPTEFARSLPVLETLLRQHRPALVLAVGQAGGRSQVSLERVAINLIDAPAYELLRNLSDIRNAFAHAEDDRDFSHQDIHYKVKNFIL